MNTFKRMKAIVDLMSTFDLLIDVGCDHGYLGIMALKAQKTQAVWNVDINLEPLNFAKENYQKMCLCNSNVEFFLSDGFDHLPTTFIGTKILVVLSGIGTPLILKILQKLPHYVTHIIVLSHTLAEKIRLWSKENYFYLLNEQYINEAQIIYELIFLTKNHQESQLTYNDPEELLLGKKQFYERPKNYLNFLKYWHSKALKLKKIDCVHRKDFQQKQLNIIEKILNNESKNFQN